MSIDAYGTDRPMAVTRPCSSTVANGVAIELVDAGGGVGPGEVLVEHPCALGLVSVDEVPAAVAL
jgi:hypothetical protein